MLLSENIIADENILALAAGQTYTQTFNSCKIWIILPNI